jgi:hypothetical protein
MMENTALEKSMTMDEVINAICQVFKETDYDKLKSAWITSRERTKYYKNELYPKVSEILKLNYETEFMRVDYVLGKKVDKAIVPFIGIESENSSESIGTELNHLYAFDTPLKIIMTCFEFTNINNNRVSEHGTKQIENWSNHLKKLHDIYPKNGVISFLIIELMRERFNIHLIILNNDGNLLTQKLNILNIIKIE